MNDHFSWSSNPTSFKKPRQQVKVLLPPRTTTLQVPRESFWGSDTRQKLYEHELTLPSRWVCYGKKREPETREKSRWCIRPQADHSNGTLGTLTVWRGYLPHSNSPHRHRHSHIIHLHICTTLQTDMGDWRQQQRHLVAWYHQPGSGDIRWVMEHSRARNWK